MALSVGSSWTSLSPNSLSLRKHSKPNIRRIMEGCGHQLKHRRSTNGKPAWPVHGEITSKAEFAKSRSLLVSFGTSLDQSHNTELKTEDLEEEKLHSAQEEDTVKGSSYLLMERAAGKPGLISFHGLPYQQQEEAPVSGLSKEPLNLLWFIGPTILVSSFVFPSLFMRSIVLTVFEDSLLTDFLILFFTEALFYGGVALFVLLIDHVWKPLQLATSRNNIRPKTHFGLRLSSVAVLVLSLIIPLVTMGMVWPWTGPAASATLAPYLVGLVVQFAFEQYARHRKSTAWPVIPVVFQVYRLHQLNRAAQLVTALSFSVRGAETTSQTLAINNSLGTLLNVLQLLGVICIWSFSSFLMRFIPSSPVSLDP